MKRYRLITLLIISSFFACNNATEELSDNNQEEGFIRIPKSIFQEMEMKEVGMISTLNQETIKCTGSIDAPPQYRASISNFLGGYVVENLKIIGDKVNKGEVLLKLNNPDFIHLQEDYLALKSEVEYNKKAYERQTNLYKDSISSQEQYQNAKKNYEIKAARIQALEQKLRILDVDINNLSASNMKSSIAVYSPIDGVVSETHTQLGSYVSPESVMMEVIDGSHLHLELDIYEKDIAQIKEEQKILFKVTNAKSKIYEGEVHLIGNTVDQVKRTVPIHGHIPDSIIKNLRVGMFISADIIVNEVNMFKYPDGTIIKNDERWNGIRIVEEGEEEYLCEIVDLGFAANSLEYKTEEKSDLKLLYGAYHFIGIEEEGGEH